MVTFSIETQVVLVLGICLVTSYLLNLLLKKIQLPSMISPMIIGLVLNIAILNNYLYFLPDFKHILSLFANFGVIIVLFFIGLKVDFRFIKDLSKNSSIMALNAAHIPFFLGLFATYFYTRNIVQSLFVGLALAITAEEVTIAILDELRLLRKRVGQLIIEAGIIGDIFEIMAIALLGLFIRTKSMTQFAKIFTIIAELVMFITIIIIVRYYIIEALLKIHGRKGRKYEYFGAAFVVLMIMTIAAELLNFSYIIGALIAGLLLKDKFVHGKLYYEEHQIVEAIEVFNFGVFHPLIFIWIGLSLDFNILFSNIEFGVVLTVLALVGKIIGTVLGNYFCHEPLSEGILIGWGLNARGATELFALLIARNQGIINQDIFAAVVFMAFVTTIISPIMFKFLAMRGYGMVKHRHRKKVHEEILKTKQLT